MTVAPKLYVVRAVNALRKVKPLADAAPQGRACPQPPTCSLHSTICGLDFEAYVRLASRVSGLPIAAARHGAREVARRPGQRGRRGAPGMPGRRDGATGANSDGVRVARCGPAAERSSRCTRQGTRPVCTQNGRRRSRWATASPSGRRGASRSPGHRLVHALRQSGFRDDDARVPAHRLRGCRRAHRSGRPGDGLRRPGRRRQVRRRPGGAHQRAGPDQDPHHRRSGLARLPRRDRRFDRPSGRDGVRQHDCRALRGRRRARWRMRSPSGCHRLRRCRSPTNGPFCPSSRWPRRRRWPTTSRPRPRRRHRCSVPTRWSPTSATGTPRYALRCTWSPDRTASRSTSSCRSRASGSRRGHAPTVSRRCAARWSSTPSPATRN